MESKHIIILLFLGIILFLYFNRKESFDYCLNNDNINFGDYNIGQLTTTQVFRDPAAWYHIVISADTTQATSSNRVKIYVNGNQVTSFANSTYPSQNYNTRISDTTSPNSMASSRMLAWA